MMWQLLVDDPRLIIELEEQYGEDWEESGHARLDLYAYRTCPSGESAWRF